MPQEFLGDRKRALEDSFFDKENKRLLERLRAEKDRAEARAGLVEASGIGDGALVDKLVELDVGPDTWAAVSLVPLIEVAWADGKMDAKEREAVLSAAEANGIVNGSPSWHLLVSWLERRPDARLLEAWGEYMVDLCRTLDATQRAALRKEIMDRARHVAESAGGILGLMNKISPEEQTVLRELEKAFAD